ncbi:alpha/beta-hydrolase family protein [Ruania alkalisoli]|uniref:Alpha/beta-hydrolase family protein n=1 Tax=Ruania alkalisoli TaxID=2779775 RepID=A0A7M1SV50_9MICO|nr:alpha/beta-hydrolase family protein [Ruania alkalisoli]QOR70622.1 alpha/beta-hydrolase family protein [Ruania alkalisoli]
MPTVEQVLFRIARLARHVLLGVIAAVSLTLSSPVVLTLALDAVGAAPAHELAEGGRLGYQPATRDRDGLRERFRPDGECSVPAAIPVPFGLRAACQVHDLAYDELRLARESGQHGDWTTGLARWVADVEFVLRGHRQCRGAAPLGRPVCHGVVALMGTAVTLNSIRQVYGPTPHETPAQLALWVGGLAALIGVPRIPRTAGRHEREFLESVSSHQVAGIYLGLRPARTFRERLDRLRSDVERAAQAGDVVLVVTTGSGWVNPYAVHGLARARNGPVTVIAFQYSRLPSWAVAILRPHLPARVARSALSAAVDGVRSVRHHGAQGRLWVHGESLGAAGIRAALAQRPRLADLVDGGLLVSPPGSVEWRGPEHIDVVRHHDDAVVWFTPRLLVRPLRWHHAPGDGRPAPPPYRQPWRPVLSYLRVVAALPRAGDLPYGHGHRYGPELASAWARVLSGSHRVAVQPRGAG